MCTCMGSPFVPYPNEVAQCHRGPNHGSWGRQGLPTVHGGEDAEHQLQRENQLHGHGLASGGAVVDLGREGYMGVDLGSEHRTVTLPSASCFPRLRADTASEPKEVRGVCAAGSHHTRMPAPRASA